MIHFLEITKENFERFQSSILEIEKSSFPSPWSLNAFIEEIDRSISHLWALLVEEVLKAYICFWIVSGEAHLMNIAVHPGGRSKGFGRYLLSRMIEFGESKTIHAVWLEVRPSNVIARQLYEKMGFTETGRRPRYYRDTNEDAIIMCLPRYHMDTNYPSMSERPDSQVVF
jgi:ribosomal-protein-alanine N-acetyltransferase